MCVQAVVDNEGIGYGLGTSVYDSVLAQWATRFFIASRHSKCLSHDPIVDGQIHIMNYQFLLA
jgi:hypothetical protein